MADEVSGELLLKNWLTGCGFEEFFPKLLAEDITDLTHFGDLMEVDVQRMLDKWGIGIRTQRKFLVQVKALLADAKNMPPSYVAPDSNDDGVVLCGTHNKPVELLCTQDDTLICIMCVPTTHHGHKCETLADGAAVVREDMERLCEAAIGRVEKFKAAEERVNGCLVGFGATIAEEKRKLRAWFDLMAQALQDREKALAEELDAMHRPRLTTLGEVQATLRDEREQAEGTIGTILQKSRLPSSAASDSQLLASKNQWQSSLEDLNTDDKPLLDAGTLTAALPDLECTMEIETALAHIAGVGKVTDKSTCAKSSFAMGPGLLKPTIKQPTTFIITAKDGQGLLRGKGGDMFQIDVSGEKVDIADGKDGTYLVTYVPQKKTNKVHVRLAGQYIQGSPFEVTTATPHTGYWNCGTHGDRFSHRGRNAINYWVGLQHNIMTIGPNTWCCSVPFKEGGPCRWTCCRSNKHFVPTCEEHGPLPITPVPPPPPQEIPKVVSNPDSPSPDKEAAPVDKSAETKTEKPEKFDRGTLPRKGIAHLFQKSGDFGKPK